MYFMISNTGGVAFSLTFDEHPEESITHVQIHNTHTHTHTHTYTQKMGYRTQISKPGTP